MRFQPQKLLDIGRWFDIFPNIHDGPPSPLYLVAAVVFALWTIVSLFLYLRRRQIFAGRGAMIGMVSRFGGYAITVGVLGLFFLAMRYLEVPYLDIRFLLYLTILATIGDAIFIVYYLRWRYPLRVREVELHEIRRRYGPERKKRKRKR